MKLNLICKIPSLLVSGVGPRLKIHLLLLRYCRSKNNARAARFIAKRIQRKFMIYISPLADIPASVKFVHPTGVVIGDGVVLGERVKIYQNVTLGGARTGDATMSNYPEVGDDTVIFAGAVVVGRINIGKNCVIGANSVVLKDIPDYATAVGAPARTIRSRDSIRSD